MRERGGECFVITPHHVVDGSINITVVAEGRIERKARYETAYGGDVALLRLERDRPLNCPPFWDRGEKVSSHLENVNDAVLVSLNEDGSISRRFMRIVSYDDRLIIIRPTGPQDQLFKGLSGSLLKIRGAPAGMLMQVDSDTGDGLILRIEHLSDIINRFFALKINAPMLQADNFTITAESFRAIVTKTADIKMQPDQLSKTVDKIKVGRSIQVTGRVKERLWYRVKTNGGEAGFVRTDALQAL